MMNGIREHYNKTLAPELMKSLQLTNRLSVPKVSKVSINVGLSKSLQDKKFIDVATATLTRIAGQKPMHTKAKKSISNFKIRQGMVVGAAVTLRGKRMYDFIEKLVSVAFPRIRDFHGLDPKKGFDENGNYTIGFKEHVVFPEIGSDEIENIHGLEVTISTTANTREAAFLLLKGLGFPFKK